jgi:phenylalanyl-tRNA synthetase alpha chain
MIEEIRDARAAALDRIGRAETVAELGVVTADAVGKKGVLASYRNRLGSLDSIEERKAAGAVVNEAIVAVQQAAADRRLYFAAGERAARLAAERIELTEVVAPLTRGHAHLVTQAWERLEDVFIGLGFQVAEGPEVETDFYNFEALNMPPSHPARSMHDTFWVDYGAPGSTVLRTHTSPVQIRVMQSWHPPIYAVMPGRVYRNETPDATHLPVFHQIEGLVIDRNISLADLAGTIEAFTRAFFGDKFTSRLRPSFFPFTEPSAEFDIRRPDGSWIELGGCGMVHPNVLRAGGLDPEEWSGFAFGFGIDRMAKERHGVDDIRVMYSDDLRFVEQF